jgi:hypothetical protein
MSKDTVSPDPVLEELSQVLRPVADKIDASDEHAMLTLGAKYVSNPDNPEQFGVHTFFAVTGFYELIAEGLYAELREMMEEGDLSLFYILREVIQDLEADLDVQNTGEEFVDEGPGGKTLH